MLYCAGMLDTVTVRFLLEGWKKGEVVAKNRNGFISSHDRASRSPDSFRV